MLDMLSSAWLHKKAGTVSMYIGWVRDEVSGMEKKSFDASLHEMVSLYVTR